MYGSSAPERLMQILQLVQGQMVESHCINVRPGTKLPKQSILAFQYLGFVTSSSSNTDDEPEVIFSCIDVLKLTKSANRMLWGKFGFSINFPGDVTDEKVYYPLQKFTNNFFSDMLLQEIDQVPSIGVPPDDKNWMNEPIDNFLKNDKKQDIEDINVIFQFAIDVEAHGTQIPLSMLSHGIAMRLQARNKNKPRTLPMQFLQQRWN